MLSFAFPDHQAHGLGKSLIYQEHQHKVVLTLVHVGQAKQLPRVFLQMSDVGTYGSYRVLYTIVRISLRVSQYGYPNSKTANIVCNIIDKMVTNLQFQAWWLSKHSHV